MLDIYGQTLQVDGNCMFAVACLLAGAYFIDDVIQIITIMANSNRFANIINLARATIHVADGEPF